MKKGAAILLLIFTLVQAGPVICSFFSPTVTIFMADEEKGPEKTELEKKNTKKDYLGCFFDVSENNAALRTEYHISEDIHHSPTLEKLTPPPNFC